MTKIKKFITKAALVLFSALLAVGSAFAPATLAFAAPSSIYDRSSIEEDLAEVDLSAYPKVQNGKHRLLDGVGFVEYAYTSRSSQSQYFGLYFYVYNPSERELSTRAGAHVVNMAVKYNEYGEPVDYENCGLTLLDSTEDNRFLKFKLTNSTAAYERASGYAVEHDGERRYDIASFQLWFAGDRNATDSLAGDGKEERGITFRCTGYAEGCGPDQSAESTLKIEQSDLDTIELQVYSTFRRTQTSDKGPDHQYQLDTVYFAVPKRLSDEYGTLQRIKAEWYEFRTQPIVVTSNQDFYYDIRSYVGKQLPTYYESKTGKYTGWYDEELQWAWSDFNVRGMDGDNPDSGWWDPGIEYMWVYGLNWNYSSPTIRNFMDGYASNQGIRAFYYLLPTRNWTAISGYDPRSDYNDSIEGGKSALENYIYTYTNSYYNGKLTMKEGDISADLFTRGIDSDRLVNDERGVIQSGFDGKSVYDIDIDLDLNVMKSWSSTNPKWWQGRKKHSGQLWIDDPLPAEANRVIPPIEILSAGTDKLDGTDEEVAERLFIGVNEVSKGEYSLRQMYQDAVTIDPNDPNDEEMEVVLFHFATSDYHAGEGVIYSTGKNSIIAEEMYIAQEEIYLSFDIIQLTYSKDGYLKVIPVASSPIDIIDNPTPPVTFGGKDLNYDIMIGLGIIAGVSLIGLMIIGLKIGIEKYIESQNPMSYIK